MMFGICFLLSAPRGQLAWVYVLENFKEQNGMHSCHEHDNGDQIDVPELEVLMATWHHLAIRNKQNNNYLNGLFHAFIANGVARALPTSQNISI